MSKKLKKIIKIIPHQVENINREILYKRIKKEILELKVK